jgi:hypothetical protein
MFFKNNTYSKIDKNQKIKEIYSDEINNQCFDCGKPNPNFISANNGVFICKDCMGIHYQFSDEISLLIKNNLFLLDDQQINYIYYGGNRKLLEFFNSEYPELINYPPEILYKTLAMQYYRDILFYMVEGGNKPIKPNENTAYKLIPDYLSYYSLTEKREKKNNYVYNNNKILSSNTYNVKENEHKKNKLFNMKEEDDNINSYLNRNKKNSIFYKYYTTKVYRNKNKEDKNNKTDYKNRNRESDNIYLVTNNNINNNNNSGKNNYYQNREKFFKEMNKLFGFSDYEEEDNYENSEQDNNFVKNIIYKYKDNNYQYSINSNNKSKDKNNLNNYRKYKTYK